MKQRHFFTFATLLSLAFSPLAQAASPPLTSEVEKIDGEIKTLEESLNTLREAALNKEIKSQPLLFDNWEAFAQGIKANEEDEKKILEIKKQIEELQQKKHALLHHNSSK